MNTPYQRIAKPCVFRSFTGNWILLTKRTATHTASAMFVNFVEYLSLFNKEWQKK